MFLKVLNKVSACKHVASTPTLTTWLLCSNSALAPTAVLPAWLLALTLYVCMCVLYVCACPPPPLPPHVSLPLFWPKNANFVIFMQFVAILPKLFPPTTTSRPHPLGNPAFLLTLTTLTFQPIIVIWVKKDKIDKSFFSNFKNFSITVATAPIWLFAWVSGRL